MGFRTIVIKNRSKLDLKFNYMVCRGENEYRVFIPEISNLIIETTAVSITSALLSELVKNNVKIIFCDEKHNPESELVAYRSNYISSKRILMQIEWDKDFSMLVWTKIIQNKIYQQAKFLKQLNKEKESNMLTEYISQLQIGDSTNREGHSAKVYFGALFGKNFERRNETLINSMLNYGYSILLSCFNREIVAKGYLTQLGLWHKNEFNPFNLSCDLLEPFRVLIDRIAYNVDEDCNDFKANVLEVFNINVKIDGKIQTFENAIGLYCQSVFDALNEKDLTKIKFYEL